MLAFPAFAQQSADPAPVRITQTIDDSVLTKLKGNVHPLARRQYDKGAVNPSLAADRMQLVLKRSPGQEIALRQLLGSMHDPNSKQYRKWLTPEQFGAEFGVSDADIQTVSTWLASQGFKVNKVNKARTVIEFSGSVGQLQNAFHTEIHSFTVNGQQHMANISDPQIPSALAPVVAGVSSMNNFFPGFPHVKPQPVTYDQAARKFVPALTSGSAAKGYFLYLTPADAATIYDTPNAFNLNFTTGTAYDGTGVTIGIIGESDIDLSAVANYRSLFGLPALTPTVVTDGPDPGVDLNGEVEAYLDLEASGGLAPGAGLIYYEAGDTSFNAGYSLAINRALDDNLVGIVSASLQTCELYLGSSGNQLIYSQWEQAAAQGITAIVASSDSGSAGCDDFDTEQQATLGLQVNGLSSTPFNVSVGGTDYDVLESDYSKYASTTNRANLGSALSYIPEAPWNDSTSVNGLLSANVATQDSNGNTNIVAGSGGLSGCVAPEVDSAGNFVDCGPVYTDSAITGWAKPSWQTGGTLNIPDDGVRDLPDLSLMAGDGYYGAAWLICSSVDFSGNPSTQCVPDSTGQFNAEGVGGTSAAAPAFAGILALVSQSQGSVRLGQANYVLYNLANQATVYSSVFHDITTGNNAVYCTPGTPDCGTNSFETGYNTGVGYDLASGLGSVDASQLIADWTKAVFTPSTTAFTINGGTAPVSITHGQAVTLSATVTGTGGTPTGDVAIIGNANEQANTYGANGLTVLNLTGGTTGPTTFANLPGGTYTVSANYGGDIDFAQSASTPGIQVTVAKEDSVLDLGAQTISGNLTPSSSVPYGTYITFDAQPVGVSQASASSPAYATGSVVFSDTAGLPSGVSGTVAINSFGYAEFPFYYWTPATHSVSATYAGDNSLNASSATAIPFTITQAPTANRVSANPATVSSGTFQLGSIITPNPGAYGAAYPTGTVTFTANGATIGTGTLSPAQDQNTGASLGTVTITANASSLATGANTITATYAGDTNYVGSSGTVVVTSTSTPVSGSFAITGSAVSVAAGATSGNTSTITVTPANGFTGAVNLTAALTTSPAGAVDPPTITLAAGSVTVTGTSAATTAATIATTGPTTGALAYPNPMRWYTAAGGAALACVLFFGIPARRRGWGSTLGLILVLAAMVGVGCGGGGKSSSTISVTPASSSIALNQALAVKVAVTGSGTPTGTVILSSGSYTSSPQTLSGGSATISVPANSLTVGTATITATYSGDSKNNSSTGTAAVTVTAAVNPGTTPGAYVFTITGTDAATGKITATGTINLTVN